jgi:hypothetical protein
MGKTVGKIADIDSKLTSDWERIGSLTLFVAVVTLFVAAYYVTTM